MANVGFSVLAGTNLNLVIFHYLFVVYATYKVTLGQVSFLDSKIPA